MKKWILLILSVLLFASAVVALRTAEMPENVEAREDVRSIFQDVHEKDWFVNQVQYVYDRGIMTGMDKKYFGPSVNLARAQFATILWRMEGAPKTEYRAVFQDVPNEKTLFYKDAVMWAGGKETGIITGYSSGNFGPGDDITREQIAVMLYRYAKYKGYDTNIASKTIDFPDQDRVSEFAGDAVAWAVEKKLITGDQGKLCPQGRTNRAVCAAMIQRFLVNVAGPWVDDLETPPEKETSTIPYDGNYPEHEPYGEGIGVMPGRVVWAHDPASVEWDGSGYWWETDHFNEEAVLKMVNHSIASLGGKENAKDGWAALFAAHNKTRGRSGGYTAGEKIAIKANINGSAVMDDDTSGRTNMSYTNPVLLKVLLTSMVTEAGIAPSDITVYDVSRLFPDYMVEMCTEGNLKGIQFVGRDNGTADENAPIQWSYAFGGMVNDLPTCVTRADYIINLANLKGHSYGITLCGKNHFGSFINGNTMRPPEGANLHQWLTRSEMGIYSPLVDLMANADLGGKTVLYMLDALICAPSEGASITAQNSRWVQEPFDGDYTSSIFVSQDPVAIDSVGADFLNNEPTVTDNNRSAADITNENYLHEAGLVRKAPSGTHYTDGNGHIVLNLGVHEHWNNSVDKQYSRNLGKEEGIELVHLEMEETISAGEK